MKVYAELPKGRGFVLRVSRDQYQAYELVDVWVLYDARPGSPDTLRPTPKSANLPRRRLPALLAALQAAGAEAPEGGRIPLGPRMQDGR